MAEVKKWRTRVKKRPKPEKKWVVPAVSLFGTIMSTALLVKK